MQNSDQQVPTTETGLCGLPSVLISSSDDFQVDDLGLFLQNDLKTPSFADKTLDKSSSMFNFENINIDLLEQYILLDAGKSQEDQGNVIESKLAEARSESINVHHPSVKIKDCSEIKTLVDDKLGSPSNEIIEGEWKYQTRDRDGSFSSEISWNSSLSEEDMPTSAQTSSQSTGIVPPRSLSFPSFPTISSPSTFSIPTPTFTTPVSQMMQPDAAYISKDHTFLDSGLLPKRRISTERDPLTFDLDRPIHLWEFLLELLEHPKLYSSYMRWIDRGAGIFKIEDSTQVAKLWGRRKNRPAMNYDKLSRSIRQYYKKGIIMKTGDSKRLIYKFGARFAPK